MASLALHDKEADDDSFLAWLPLIERAASDERNFVKKGVSWALRGIGERNAAMHDAALELAERLSRSEHPVERWLRKYEAGALDDDAQAADLIQAELDTGRTHQIRVHLAHIGHPLLGDDLYGPGFKTKAAHLVQVQAFERYSREPSIAIDPALIRLDQAVGEASRGDVEGACELAVSTLEQLPQDHRTRIVLTRVLDVLAALPAAQRQRRPATELRELVAAQGKPG